MLKDYQYAFGHAAYDCFRDGNENRITEVIERDDWYVDVDETRGISERIKSGCRKREKQ